MNTYEVLDCENCKFYEPYHYYLNPNATPQHYCKKCKEEIRYVRQGKDYYAVWVPKACYLHNYFEESEEYKAKKEAYSTIGPLAYQTEY